MEQTVLFLDWMEMLPEEMRDEVLDYLEYNEVLRLRLVCFQFMTLANYHLKRRIPPNHPEIIQFDGYPRSLSEFRKVFESSDFPIIKLAFTNTSKKCFAEDWDGFLKSPDLDWFIDYYAFHVKYLAFDSLELPIRNKTLLQFIESFENIEALEVDFLITRYPEMFEKYPEEEAWEIPFVFIPDSFKNLKRFEVTEVTCLDPNSQDHSKEIGLFWKILEGICTTTCLEKFKHPYVTDYEYSHMDITSHLKHIIKMIEDGRKHKKSLKIFSILTICEAVMCEHHVDIEVFREFLNLCTTAKVQLDDADDGCGWFLCCYKNLYGDLVRTLESSIPDYLMNLKFLQLRKLRIDFDRHQRPIPEGELKCPNLQGLCVNFGSHLDKEESGQRFAKFAFQQAARTKLKSIALSYAPNTSVFVSPVDISKACPNLAYLCLRNCTADNTFFLDLWTKLRTLEHIRLSGCSNLGDEGLIGSGSADPAICGLKRLKYFELDDLSNMPGITDRTLTLAICHLNLRFLRLSSNKYTSDDDEFDHLLSSHSKRFRESTGDIHEPAPIEISTISVVGIRALNSGALSKTIEKLCINQLTVTGLPKEELLKIKREFRSEQF